MKITVQDGMVNIDHDNFSYSNIRNMYIGSNGCGLQTNPPFGRTSILRICNEIAERIYELQDEMERV
ncbi:MAG: hypothetical protein ACOCP4_01945 [Candidatus Woesearchaeota archaeon]